MHSQPTEKSGLRQQFLNFLQGSKLAKIVPFRRWLVIKLSLPSPPIVNHGSSLSSSPPKTSLYQREAYTGTFSNWLEKAAAANDPQTAKVLYTQAFQRKEQQHQLGTYYYRFQNSQPSAVLKLVKGVGETERAHLAPLLGQALDLDFFPAGLILLNHYALIMDSIENRNCGKTSDQWSPTDNQSYMAARQAKESCLKKTFQDNDEIIGHFKAFCQGDRSEQHCIPLAKYFVEYDPETAFSFLAPVLNSTNYKDKKGSVRTIYNSIIERAASNQELINSMKAKRKAKAK